MSAAVKDCTCCRTPGSCLLCLWLRWHMQISAFPHLRRARSQTTQRSVPFRGSTRSLSTPGTREVRTRTTSCESSTKGPRSCPRCKNALLLLNQAAFAQDDHAGGAEDPAVVPQGGRCLDLPAGLARGGLPAVERADRCAWVGGLAFFVHCAKQRLCSA